MKKTILLITALVLCLGCAGTSKTKSASGEPAKKSEEKAPAKKSDSKASSKKSGSKVDLSNVCTVDFYISSLHRVLTSSIGSGDVELFLLRAKLIKCNMYNANICLEVARKVLPKLVATNEQLEQIKQKRKELQAAKGKDQEKIEIELQAYQDSIITEANKNNSYDNKTLDENQKILVVTMDFNLILAGIYELIAVKDAALMIVEGKSMIENIKSNPANALKMAGRVTEITNFITVDAPLVGKLVPEHTRSFSQFTTALSAIKKNNKIESNEQPKAGDTFKPMAMADDE